MRRLSPIGLVRLAIPVLLGAALFAPARAEAQVTFATFAETDPGNGFVFTNTGTAPATVSVVATSTFNFNFTNVPGLGATVFTGVKLTVTGGTSDPALASRGTTYQTFSSQNLVFTFTSGTGQTLLVATVRDNSPATATGGSNGLITPVGGSAASATFDNKSTQQPGPDFVTFSSPFLGFTNATEESAAFSFNSVVDPSGVGSVNPLDGILTSFTSSLSGSFASTPAPAVMPEPASVAMLAIGLVGLPIIARRRNRKSAVASA